LGFNEGFKRIHQTINVSEQYKERFDERDTLIRAEVRQPVPEEDTFDANDDIFPIKCYQLQEYLRLSRGILMGKNIPLPV
jgi:hypothetical protein